MAEIRTDLPEPEETGDLFEDQRAAVRRLLGQSVDRVGLSVVAHQVGRDPSTLSHALSYRDPSKLPSAEVFAVCFLLDGEFRRRLCKLRKEEVLREPDLTPEQALREAMVKAQSGEFGNAGLRAMSELYARVKR